MNDMLRLIKDYQETVKYGVEQMQAEFNTLELLRGWKNKSIPKEGVLSSSIEYDFHGIGCLITINNITVNFDFGPGGRFDGFDLWRLTCFMEEKPDVYKCYLDNQDLLKNEFQKLLDNNIIVKPNWDYSNLFYLSDSL